MQKILQVSIDACLRVNRGLLHRQKVVKLHNSNGYCFILLRLLDRQPQMGILNDLARQGGQEMRISYMPPIIADARRILIISKSLHHSQRDSIVTYL